MKLKLLLTLFSLSAYAQVPESVNGQTATVMAGNFWPVDPTGKACTVGSDVNLNWNAGSYRCQGASGVLAAKYGLVQANSYALQFTKAKTNNVDFGPFWASNTDYSPVFLWEAWVNRTASAEYIISDGYGGAHVVLFGFSGNALTGNTWISPANTAVSFGSNIGVPVNEWHYVAVGGDGAYITTYLDGCPVGQVASTANRNTMGNGGTGVLYIGGSNHSNFDGLIRQVRGWENGFNPAYDIALGANNCFVPEPSLSRSTILNRTGTALQQSSFMADFSNPASTIADLSSGVTSVNRFHHNGKLGNTANVGASPWAWANKDTAAPVFVSTSFVKPGYSGPAPGATPVNAVAYDQFRRADTTYAWGGTPSLGTAPTGQIWSVASSSPCGIQQQTMFCALGTSYGTALLNVGKAKQDMTVTFLKGPFPVAPYLTLYANYVDPSNFVQVKLLGTTVYIGKTTAGVNAWYSGCSFIAAAAPTNSFQVTISGTSLVVKRNGAAICSATDASLPGGLNVGISLLGPMTRVTSVTVY